MNRDDDEAISDEELSAAALTLATLEGDAPLPARVRQRVEASGRSVLGERASEHARRRAASTSSAGTQVIVAMGEAPPSRVRRLASYPWVGAAVFAAAAALILLVRSRLPATTAGAGNHDVERIAVGDASGARGELRYDRGDGTGALTITQSPASAGETLELWITFEGDTTPRAVALLPATVSEVAFGAGQPICRPVSGSSCAPVQAVFVTRESALGTLVFVPERAVLRGRAAAR